MGHRGQGGPGVGEHGVEGLCPPTGLITGLSMIISAGAAFWVFAKHPRVFGCALLASMVLVAIFYRHGSILSGNPFVGLFCVIVGVACCTGGLNNKAKNRPTKPHNH